MNPIAHHEPHCARVKIRPDTFRAVPLFCHQQRLSGLIQGIIPGDRFKFARSFVSTSTKRLRQTVRVVNSFAVAGYFAADNAGGIGVLRSAPNLADMMRINLLDLQSAGRRTIVGTSAGVNHK